jgi:hypothetical protein
MYFAGVEMCCFILKLLFIFLAKIKYKDDYANEII